MSDPYVGLKTEQAKPAYNSLSDAAIVTAINMPGAMIPQQVPFIWVNDFFVQTGLRAIIDDLSKDATSPFRSACLGLIDCFWGVGVNRYLDVTDPKILELLGEFVLATLMTSKQHDDLVNLAAIPGPSIAQTLGFPFGITAEDLAAARSR